MVLNQSQLNETNPIRLLLILHGKEEEDVPCHLQSIHTQKKKKKNGKN
jgi:hypothetical protein